MQRLAFCCLAFLLAVALAAPPFCNTTLVCVKETETGCNPGSFTYFPFCAVGTECNSNTCIKSPRLGEPCSGTNRCFDPDYDITCDGSGSGSGVCRYEDIYGPGDSCKPTNSNYKNGGCLSDLTCSPTTSKCSGLTLGVDCNGNDKACPYHTYCDGTTSQCTARKASGQTCNANYECDETLVCTDHDTEPSRTCQAPFTRTQGQSCDDDFDCAANLGCKSNICTGVPQDGQDCSNDENVCDSYFGDCVCSVDHSGRNTSTELPATCENRESRFNTNDYINAYKGMQSCLKGKNCHDYWVTSQVLDLESGPDQCIRSCLKGDFETGYEKQGQKFNTCGSSVIFPSLLIILGVLIALF